MSVMEAVRSEVESLAGSNPANTVRTMKAKASDAITDAAEVAGRTVEDAVAAVRRRARNLEHVPEDVAYQVRRAPFLSIGAALGVGVLAGALFGWLASRTLSGRKDEAPEQR